MHPDGHAARDHRAIRLLPELTWLALRETVKNIYFLVIVLAGVLFTILASRTTGALYGTETYPVTASVVEIIGGSFGMFMLIIITFYAGELVWRERDAGADQLMDVLPIPNWLPLAAKLFALILIQVLLLVDCHGVLHGHSGQSGLFPFRASGIRAGIVRHQARLFRPGVSLSNHGAGVGES